MNIADKLRAAADIIDEKGLAKKFFVDGEGRVCTWQAIAWGSLPNTATDALGYMRDYLNTKNLTTWNDKKERTKEEVAKTLRTAADKWTNSAKS